MPVEGGQGVYDADHRYRDQILHVEGDPDWKGDLALLKAFAAMREAQDVQGMQAPSAQAVTGGHGECCCSECETGWAAAWAAWVGR